MINKTLYRICCFLVSALLTAALLFVTGCLDDPDLRPLPFFEVQMLEITKTGLGKVELKGRITALENNIPVQPVDYGFFVSEQNQTPQLGAVGIQQISFSGEFASAFFDFSDEISELSLEVERYYVWAYAKIGDRTKISASSIDFTFSTDFNFIVDTVLVNNKTIKCQSVILGLENLSESFVQHGHLYSLDAEPLLGKPGVIYDTLGSLNDDGIFESSFPDLNLNTSYFVRAYALNEASDIFYSENIRKVDICDGWTTSFEFPRPGFRGGIAAALNGRVYLGIGCQSTVECNEASHIRNFWEFNPNAAGPMDAYTEKTSFPDTHRINAVAFSLEDMVYVGLGKAFYPGQTIMLKSFQRFDPLANDGNGAWEPIAPFPGKGRENAVAFTANGRAYVGSGKDSSLFIVYNDFYEYHPGSDTWRQVADLNFMNSSGEVGEMGRQGAVIFTIAGESYVGLGRTATELATDIWKFVPPGSDNEPGEWFHIDWLPPEVAPRQQAVAFSFDNNRAFIGLGVQISNSRTFFMDLWEYNPLAPPDSIWIKRTDFQGEGRREAIVFSINNKGYIGTGLYQPNSITNISLNDFWQYTPKN